MGSQPEHDKQPITWFLGEYKGGRLNLVPEIQRRSVWKPKKRMLLIDTIARQLPIGVITLYQTTKSGIPHYDVIDGKQRLEAIFGFMGEMGEDDNFTVDSRVITDGNSTTEGLSVGKSFAKQVAGRTWKKLAKNPKLRIKGYTIPVTIVKGKKIVAVEAFTRMNAAAYPLSPQEVRHAVFRDTEFMGSIEKLCTDITEHCNKDLPDDGSNPNRKVERTSAFYAMGAISKVGLERMDDYQIASELVHLQLQGAQYARKDLSLAYTTYSRPNKSKERETACRQVLLSLKRVWAIIEHKKLQDINCMRQKDEFLYALIGALRDHHISGGLGNDPFKSAVSDLRKTLSVFMAEITKYGDKNTKKTGFSALVRNYGDSSTGQRNSMESRTTRIDALKVLLEGIVPKTGEPFSRNTRMNIWIDGDKKCAKCEKPVTWDDFDAGHIIARAYNGPATANNGRVECASCNRSDGAR